MIPIFFMKVKGHLRSPGSMSEHHENTISQEVKVLWTSNLVFSSPCWVDYPYFFMEVNVIEVKRGESLNKSSMYLGTHQSILQDHCPLHFWTILLVNNTEVASHYPKLLLLFMVVNNYTVGHLRLTELVTVWKIENTIAQIKVSWTFYSGMYVALGK